MTVCLIAVGLIHPVAVVSEFRAGGIQHRCSTVSRGPEYVRGGGVPESVWSGFHSGRAAGLVMGSRLVLVLFRWREIWVNGGQVRTLDSFRKFHRNGADGFRRKEEGIGIV